MFAGLASFCQFFIDALVVVLNAACSLFPPSPFQAFLGGGSAFADLLSQINFFLPIYEFGAILEAWLVAVGVYYAISVVARWLKAID